MIPSTADSDAQLARAALAGDRRAYERLVTRHKSALYRLARRYVGDADDAYDIVQEALISAWLGLRRFDPEQQFRAWLYTIALNKCRDYARRRAVRRRVLTLFAFDPSAVHDIASHAPPSPAERLNQLGQAIARLPRRYKEPLLLTVISGLTQRETADALGVTPKAVEMRIRRAKRLLTESLAPKLGSVERDEAVPERIEQHERDR